MKIKVKPNYEIICINEYGIDSKDRTLVYNRREKLEKCQKCKYHKNFNEKTLLVTCSYKGKKE